MGEIVDFPTKSVRDWLIIEGAMNEALSSHRVSTAIRDRLVERMKSFYEFLEPGLNLSIDVEFPGTLTKEQTAAICAQIGEKIRVHITEKLQAFTQKLFIDRLNVEVDLCRALGI